MTVKTPTTPVTSATTPPTTSSHAHRLAGEETGREERVQDRRSSQVDPSPRGATACARSRRLRVVDLALARDHQDATVDAEHVDVLAVQGAEHLGADHLLGRAARRPARGDVDDTVHHRQQRVHLVRRDEHRDPLLPRDPGQQGDDLLLAADVQVGQWLVQEQQPGPG